jgi:chaperonin GroES
MAALITAPVVVAGILPENWLGGAAVRGGLSQATRDVRLPAMRLTQRSRTASSAVAAVATPSRAAAVDLDKVIPQGDRVLLRLKIAEQKTSGGVLLPSSAAKFERILEGEVVALGKEVVGIQKGDKVIVSDVNAYEVFEGLLENKLVLSRGSDVLAIVETS